MSKLDAEIKIDRYFHVYFRETRENVSLIIGIYQMMSEGEKLDAKIDKNIFEKDIYLYNAESTFPNQWEIPDLIVDQ